MAALLDDHPRLIVFPEEYLYTAPRGTAEVEHPDFLSVLFKKKVLDRLKGRKSFLDELHAEQRNYVGFDYGHFEREVCAQFALLRESDMHSISREGLVLLALMGGFAETMGRRIESSWVVKHPGYERHWRAVFSDFPDARMPLYDP
jgi:hypothetical protein